MQDPDLAVTDVNQAAILQCLFDGGHAAPPDAKPVGDQRLRELQRIGLHPIVRREQPSYESL